MSERKCRVCGCTDERACPGGCEHHAKAEIIELVVTPAAEGRRILLS